MNPGGRRRLVKSVCGPWRNPVMLSYWYRYVFLEYVGALCLI